MFDTKPPDEIPPDRADRMRILRGWMRDFELDYGDYPETMAITVTVAGATFVDHVNDYPSEALFSNIALAVNTGSVKRRNRDWRGWQINRKASPKRKVP